MLILGAGPAGLAAAYQLLKTSKKYEVIILEKEKQIGGLCKTIPFKKNYVDYGVRFYRISEYEDVSKLIYQLFPIEDKKPLDNKKEINQHIRVGKNRFNSHDIMLINQASSNIYFNHQFYEYPIKMNIDTIHKMGIFNVFLIGCSYLKVLVHKRKVNDTFNIGSSEFQTMKEDYQSVLDYASYGKQIKPFPKWIALSGFRLLNLFGLSPLYK